MLYRQPHDESDILLKNILFTIKITILDNEF